MKHQWKGFISGVLVTLLLVGSIGTAMATTGKKAVEITYNNISVTLDGKAVNLVDANGNPVEPFMLSGTNYLPVRAVAEALGLNVSWDGATQTVILTHPDTTQPSQPQGGSNTSTPSTPSGTTAGQNNALSRAKQYLSIMAFSYSGLIEQLKYEGFTDAEAAYGADNCGADWNEQAAKKAQQYIDIMSFSRQRLIDQLKHDGFTQSQAEYGASAVGY